MSRFLSIALSVLLLSGGAPVFAGALLKPTTGVSQALRAKDLDVKTEINGAFARTTVTTIYANPNTDRIQADFVYSAPEGAVVTGFAYWYEGEKVVARVVEKERAAQIYHYITSRMRDPALVEMIGQNTFRARIFPVEPRKDLKIEVQLAQRLAATPTGWRWSFPLREETDEAPLDHLTMRVHLADSRAARSNLGAPNAGNTIQVARQSFTAKEDARVDLPSSAPARAEFFAARWGGRDGFFALATAGQTAPRIAGVQTFDVTTTRDKNAVFTFGRYRGAGAATALVGGQKVPLQFGSRIQSGNVASLLWAAARIESLSGRETNHDAVMALSKRFGMPSKWTSWLAIPQAERKNFKKQILASDRESAARAYAQAIARGDRAAAAREKVRVAQVTKELVAVGADYSSREERQPLSDYLDQALKDVRRARAAARYQKVSGAQLSTWQSWEKNLRRAGARDGAQGVEKPIYLIEDELRIASRLMADEIANGRATGSRAKALRARMTELVSTKNVRQNYGWSADTFLSEQTRARTQDLALEIAVNRLSARPDAHFQAVKTRQLQRLVNYSGGNTEATITQALRTAALPRAQQLASRVAAQEARGETVTGRARLVDLAKIAGQSPAELLKAARTTRVRQEFNTTTDQLVDEVLAGRQNSEKARQLQARVENLKRDSHDWWQKEAVTRAYTGRSHALAYDIEAERAKPAPDQTRIAQLKRQLNQTSSQTNRDADTYLQWEKRRLTEKQGPVEVEEYRYRVAGLDPNNVRGGYGGGDPLLQIGAPADARSVVAILPNGEVKPLEWRAHNRRWEANFDIPMDTRADSYLVTIVIVLRDGTRKTLTLRYRVDAQAPTGNALIRGAGQNELPGALHLEVGASDDTTRVVALLPWGDRLVLRRGKNGAFSSEVALPTTWAKPSVPVRFILVDAAHNRTEIAVDWNR